MLIVGDVRLRRRMGPSGYWSDDGKRDMADDSLHIARLPRHTKVFYNLLPASIVVTGSSE